MLKIFALNYHKVLYCHTDISRDQKPDPEMNLNDVIQRPSETEICRFLELTKFATELKHLALDFLPRDILIHGLCSSVSSIA